MDHTPHAADSSPTPQMNSRYLTDINEQSQILEAYTAQGIIDDDIQQELIFEVDEAVKRSILGRSLALIAVGYLPDGNGNFIPTPMVVQGTDVEYIGPSLQMLDESQRVLLEYQSYGDGSIEDSWVCFVPPEGILWAQQPEISLQHPFFTMVEQSRRDLHAMISEEDFYQQPCEAQYRLLAQRIAGELLGALSLDYPDDARVTIECGRYYQSDAPSQPKDWTPYEHGSDKLRGVIVDIVYLESLDDVPSKLHSDANFKYGNGLPCLVIRREQQSNDCYIPVDVIVNFRSKNDKLRLNDTQ